MGIVIRLIIILVCLYFVVSSLRNLLLKITKGGTQQNTFGGNPSASQQELERKFGDILGLKGKISKKDIKSAYRQQMAQYHPDKVQHMAGDFKSFAEIKSREIGEAYNYFKDKYGIK